MRMHVSIRMFTDCHFFHGQVVRQFYLMKICGEKIDFMFFTMVRLYKTAKLLPDRAGEILKLFACLIWLTGKKLLVRMNIILEIKMLKITCPYLPSDNTDNWFCQSWPELNYKEICLLVDSDRDKHSNCSKTRSPLLVAFNSKLCFLHAL
ncbi:hypothetical protein ACF0H5_012952 [Mactra antiquata]